MKVKDKDYYELCDLVFSLGAEERKKVLTLLDDMQPKDRGTIFDYALTRAYEYAESDKVVKLDRRASACDGSVQGFLDGVAYRMGGFNG